MTKKRDKVVIKIVNSFSIHLRQWLSATRKFKQIITEVSYRQRN